MFEECQSSEQASRLEVNVLPQAVVALAEV